MKPGYMACVAALLLASSASAWASSGPACPSVGFTLIEPAAAPDTRLVRDLQHRTLHVRREALTNTSDITEAKLAGDRVNPLILLKFKPDAEARLTQVTTNHPGLRFAFVADDDALLAVTWEGPYGMDPGGAQLSLNGGFDRARKLVAALQGCIGPAAN